ncbi:MAG TPA: DUF4340 domain-containing protein [Kofleriaceae bacterium]|nr:DUF4340 domain-containing protein [Kofleriaceae bacterium]
MNKLNRILLGVLAAQIALVLIFQLRGEDTTIGKLEPILPAFARDKVERLRVFDRTARAPEGEADQPASPKGKPGDKPSVDLVKKGSAWVLASHYDYPVTADKVTDLLDKIDGMRTRGAIASGAAREKQLEVADDSYQRKVIVTSGGKDTTFFVGASAGSRQTSVRLAGQEAIHGVTGLSAFGVGARASAWVEGAYVDIQPDRIASFDVVNAGGSFHLERAASGDGWQVTVGGQPLVPPAGMEINKGEIEKLAGKASRIFLSEPGDPKRSIEKPLATVTLHLKPEQVPVAGADAGAAESTLDQGGADRVIEIAATDAKDRSYVREKGRNQAALVEALGVTDLVELTRDKLVNKIGDKKAVDPGQGGPGEMPMEGLPPGFDPSQLGQP